MVSPFSIWQFVENVELCKLTPPQEEKLDGKLLNKSCNGDQFDMVTHCNFALTLARKSHMRKDKYSEPGTYTPINQVSCIAWLLTLISVVPLKYDIFDRHADSKIRPVYTYLLTVVSRKLITSPRCQPLCAIMQITFHLSQFSALALLLVLTFPNSRCAATREGFESCWSTKPGLWSSCKY
jgi:hypothetical protein